MKTKFIYILIFFILVMGVCNINVYAEDDITEENNNINIENNESNTINNEENATNNNETSNENTNNIEENKTIEVNVNDNSEAQNKEENTQVQNYNSNNKQNIKNTETQSSKSKKSSDASLKTLGITPNDFKGFKANVMSYDATVPYDVSEVKVYATVVDSKATISGIGTQKLEIGKNALNVVVTAEDGTNKTYTINVIRENIEEKTVDETKIIEDEYDLKNIKIAGYKLSPDFSPTVYEYTVDIKNDVSKLNISTECKDNNINVEVVGNDDLQDGENIITILVTNKEKKSTTTYQVVVNKAIEQIEDVDLTKKAAIAKANKIRMAFFSIVILFVIFGAIIGIKKYKSYKKYKENEIYDYDEEDVERFYGKQNDSRKINLDEEEDFFKRINNEKVNKISKVEIEHEDVTLKDNDKQQSESKKDGRTLLEEHFRINTSNKSGKHF